MGNSAHDGNLAVQQNGLPFLMLPQETLNPLNAATVFHCSGVYHWLSLCNNMGDDGGGVCGDGFYDGGGSSSSSSSSSKGDDSN
jgi:hypothetical protein